MGEHFVLIHGAWHGGWCWEGVIRELEKAGHTAEAPTMPGHHPDDDRSQIKFDDYIDKICEVLNKQPRPVVLVGHSSGGYMLQAAAPKVADKIRRLLFLNAFVLPEGKSQFDLVPPEASEAMTAAAQASPDNCVPVIEEFVRNMLMNGEPAEKQDALIEQLVPQPFALFTTAVDTGAFDKLTIPKTVVFCKGDISLPPGGYLGMARGLGEYNLIEVEGSHETFFTNPGVVAEAFEQALK